MFKPGSILLGLTLSGTLAATALTGMQENIPVSSSPAVAQPQQTLAPIANEQPELVSADRMQLDTLDRNPFDAKTWYVPPPPPPPVVAAQPVEPPKPTAPPLPFTYVGQMEEESGHAVIYLAQGSRPLAIRAGDNIDGTYRLDSIDDIAIQFTYLPLDIKQSLSIARTIP